jgi:hypothetical protein
LGNVYQNYRWCVNNPIQKHIDDVPIITLTEFQSNCGPLLENLEYTGEMLLSLAKVSVDKDLVNPYLKIYNGTPTSNIYQLPFLSEYNHAISSPWGLPNDTSDIATKTRDYVGGAMGLFQRGLIESRKIWKGTTPSRYTFAFILYNTYDPYVDIPKNLNFIRTLVHNNLPDRTSFGTVLPPCFYTVDIPGIRYSPMAVLNGVTVNNIGQVNRKGIPIIRAGDYANPDDIEVNIPDAWEVVISVTELISESRDVYNATFDSSYRSKVSVIDEGKPYELKRPQSAPSSQPQRIRPMLPFLFAPI